MSNVMSDKGFNWLNICFDAMDAYLDEIYSEDSFKSKFSNISDSALSVAQHCEKVNSHNRLQLSGFYSSRLGLLFREVFMYEKSLESYRKSLEIKDSKSLSTRS